MTYDNVTFSQSAAYGEADFLPDRRRHHRRLSSQASGDGPAANILITLPSMVKGLTIWFDTFSSTGKFNSVLLTVRRRGAHIGSVSYDTAPVPESWMLMIAGFGAIGGTMRRQRASVRFA